MTAPEPERDLEPERHAALELAPATAAGEGLAAGLAWTEEGAEEDDIERAGGCGDGCGCVR